jgi:predicted transcriptional regulator
MNPAATMPVSAPINDAWQDVPDDVQRRVEKLAKQIDKAKASHAESGFQLGDLMFKAQQELSHHGDGTFCAWVESRCGFTPRTARNYIAIATTFIGKVRESLSQTSTAEALYFLARDTTPEEAIAEAVERAERGERITLPKAKEIVAEFTGDDEPSTPPEPEELDILDAATRLDAAISKVAGVWPAVASEALADKLESVARDIRRTGLIRWLKETSDVS